LEKLLRKPRRTQSELRPAKSAVNVVTATPYATVAISAILALLFIAEILFGIGGKVLTPTIKTLVAMGGLSHALAVEDKEYYRVFTAPMLHGSAIHLGLNVVAMVMGGVVLEALLGRAWLCALFVIGALGGAAGSLLSNAHNVVSVGASGAIMGLLGAALVVSFRIPSGQERINIQMGVGRMLIPSLIPLATHRSGGSIDYGAHIGGAIAGALAALAIFSSWHPTQVMPPFRRIALGIALAGALAVTGSFGMIGKNYAQTTDILQGVGLLVPNADLPKDQEQWQAHLDEFEKKYPRDPRVQINLALRHRERNELAGAEAALRKAVAEDKLIKTMFSSNTRIDIIARALLAEILVNDGRRQQALEIAAPVCHRGEAGAVPMEFGTLDLCK
jgi:rhomboid protease GluP